jgi:hypothetical protein
MTRGQVIRLTLNGLAMGLALASMLMKCHR